MAQNDFTPRPPTQEPVPDVPEMSNTSAPAANRPNSTHTGLADAVDLLRRQVTLILQRWTNETPPPQYDEEP